MERSNLGLARPRRTLSIFGRDVLDRRLIFTDEILQESLHLFEDINGAKNARRTDLENVKHPSQYQPPSSSKAYIVTEHGFQTSFQDFEAISPVLVLTTSPPVP